jgi:hypothetical protein
MPDIKIGPYHSPAHGMERPTSDANISRKSHGKPFQTKQVSCSQSRSGAWTKQSEHAIVPDWIETLSDTSDSQADCPDTPKGIKMGRLKQSPKKHHSFHLILHTLSSGHSLWTFSNGILMDSVPGSQIYKVGHSMSSQQMDVASLSQNLMPLLSLYV